MVFTNQIIAFTKYTVKTGKQTAKKRVQGKYGFYRASHYS